VDFVLYDLKTARIIAAIELDDRSHQRPERQVRDAFFDEALSAAGVLLLRVRASSQYNPYAIRRYIELATSHRPR
jgi:very-short-patch-repair endonuclease